jgi:thioredoxin-like negative regulator of GroEL
MIERLLLAVLIGGGVAAAFQSFRRWQVWRLTSSALGDPLLSDLRPGVPAIVYFTSPTCAPCKSQQRPALQKLLAELGDRVQVVEVNALDDQDAAKRWGVMSVPTTFVLDAMGLPRQVNNGVAGADKLKRQIQGLL